MISLDIQREGRQGVIKIRGDLDIASVPVAKSQTQEVMDQGVSDFLIDLTEVGHVDTTGLGFFVWVRKRVLELKGQLILVGQNAHFKKLLEITGLHTLFTSCETLDEARARLTPA